MDMAFWQKEWVVIAAGPFLTIGGACAITVGIWFFVNWLRSQEVSGAKAQVEAWKARWELGKDKFDELQAKNTELQGLVKNLTMQIEEHATQAALRATSAKIDGVVHAIATANSDIQVYYKEGGKSLKAEPGIFKINPPLSSTEKSG